MVVEVKQKEKVQTNKAPLPRGTYSQAVKFQQLVFLSGQLPIDPKNGKLFITPPEKAISQCFENLSAICEAADGSLNHITKLTIYIADSSFSPVIDQVMPNFFTEPFPARSRVFVTKLSLDAPIEIEATMHL